MTDQSSKRPPLSGADDEAARRLRALWDDRGPKLGLTQEAAAAAMAMTQGAVWQYLNGRLQIGVEACIKWAGVLVCDPAEIRPELAPMWDTVVRLRGAKAAMPSLPSPHTTLLRACIAAAFEDAKRSDRYPSPDLIATLAADLYAQANNAANAVLDREP